MINIAPSHEIILKLFVTTETQHCFYILIRYEFILQGKNQLEQFFTSLLQL